MKQTKKLKSPIFVCDGEFDYQEAYDNYDEALDDDDNDQDENLDYEDDASDEVHFETFHSTTDDCLIDAGYEAMGIERVKYDENGNELKYETNPEILQAMFDMYRNGDKEGRALAGGLIEHLLSGLIYSIGHSAFPSYMRNKQEVRELVNAAWCGVFQVADSYDPMRAAPSTCFYRHIVHEMAEYVNRFIHKTSSYSMGIQKEIKAATERLARRGVACPRILDIAYEAGLKASAVRKAMDCFEYSRAKSFDSMAIDPTEYTSSGKSHKSRDQYENRSSSVDAYCNPFAVVSRQEDADALSNALSALTPTQRDVVCRSFGIGRAKQNNSTIFEETGIPTNEIKVILNRAMTRLRNNPDLCRVYKNGKAFEIKNDLDFEPICCTPDATAYSIMDALEEVEMIDF